MADDERVESLPEPADLLREPNRQFGRSASLGALGTWRRWRADH